MGAHRVLWPTAIACALLMPCAGCSGSDGSGTAGYESIARSELPNALASAICANVGPCCSAARKPFSASACQSAVAGESQSELGRQSAARPFDSKEAAACVNAVAAAAAACDLAKVNLRALACVSPHGKLGEPCSATCSERGSGFACSPAPSVPYADAGVSSYTVSCYTNDSLYCSAAGSCSTRADVGAACGSDGECQSEWCDSGTCHAPIAQGASCADHGCARGLYCDSFSITCGRLRENGAPCGADEQCNSGHCDQPGATGGASAVVGDAAPPPDRGTCAPPTGTSSDPQYLAFVCGE